MQLKWTTLEKHHRKCTKCTMLSFGINHLHPWTPTDTKNDVFLFGKGGFYLRLEKKWPLFGSYRILGWKKSAKIFQLHIDCTRLSDNAWQAWQVQSGRWLAWCHRNLKVPTVSGGNSSRPTVSEKNKGCKDNDHPNICLTGDMWIEVAGDMFWNCSSSIEKRVALFHGHTDNINKTCTI